MGITEGITEGTKGGYTETDNTEEAGITTGILLRGDNKELDQTITE